MFQVVRARQLGCDLREGGTKGAIFRDEWILHIHCIFIAYSLRIDCIFIASHIFAISFMKKLGGEQVNCERERRREGELFSGWNSLFLFQ